MKYGFIVFICILQHLNVEAQDTINNSIDTDSYPKKSQLYIMRRKSDSIVKSIYGEKFFNNHIRWSFKDSWYFTEYGMDDAIPYPWPPEDTNIVIQRSEFSIRYDILYDAGILKSGIRILIDKEGKLLPFHLWNDRGEKIYSQGFEKIDTTDSDFKLTTEEAIQLAGTNGLHAKDTARVSCQLEWYPAEDSTKATDSGNFYFEVTYDPEFKKGERRKFQKGYTVEYENYVWLFDPWTKEFISKSTNRRSFKTSRRY